MVTITPVAPRQWATFRLSNIYLPRWTMGPGYIVVGYNPLRGDRRIYRPGYIHTEPSQLLEGENNCFHYNVSGMLDYYVPWYDDSSTPDEWGRRKITVGSKTVSSAYSASMPDEKYENTIQRTKTVRRTSGSYWSEYRVTLNYCNFRFSMGETLEKSVLYIEWAESWDAIAHKDARHPVDPPNETSGVVQKATTTTNVQWWNKQGTVEVRVPDMRWHVWPLELYNGWESDYFLHMKERADDVSSYGDLSATAAESIRALDINSIAYLKDFADLADLVKGMTSLAKPGKGLKSIPKKVAKTYLATHYGAKLTVSDTMEIAEAIDKLDVEEYNTQSMGASSHVVVPLPGEPDIPVSVDSHCYVRIDSLAKEDLNIVKAFKKLDRALLEVDLVPSLENIWDMVPFSFVVDWFLPIGSALHQREIRSYINTLSVQAAFYSRKYTWAKRLRWVPPAGGTVEGPVTFKVYQRECLNRIILPPERVDRPKGLSKHWLEASAIIISNL